MGNCNEFLSRSRQKAWLVKLADGNYDSTWSSDTRLSRTENMVNDALSFATPGAINEQGKFAKFRDPSNNIEWNKRFPILVITYKIQTATFVTRLTVLAKRVCLQGGETTLATQIHLQISYKYPLFGLMWMKMAILIPMPIFKRNSGGH